MQQCANYKESPDKLVLRHTFVMRYINESPHYSYLCSQINRHYEVIRLLYQKHRSFPSGEVCFPMLVLLLYVIVG